MSRNSARGDAAGNAEKLLNALVVAQPGLFVLPAALGLGAKTTAVRDHLGDLEK